jgi:hypothetical protein
MSGASSGAECAERAPVYWIAVASREHVMRGIAEGFMQVCQGKAAPLRRVQPGDCVAYYSPTHRMGERQPLRCFTAWGVVRAGAAYTHEMAPGFIPWRRDVDWCAQAHEAAIVPLLPELEFVQGHASWGAPLRWGLVRISAADGARVARAMGVHHQAS